MPLTVAQQGAIKMRKLMPLMLQEDTKKSLLLNLFPIVKVDQWKLLYERMQVGVGLQTGRGNGGPTGTVPKRGIDQMVFEPGLYGDKYVLTEEELNKIREIGSLDNFANVEKLVSQGQTDLNDRYLRRLKYNVASMLINGSFRSNTSNGREVDVQVYNIPQYTPSTTFDNLSTATPLTYTRKLIPSLELGKAVNFKGGIQLMSKPTANLYLHNTNASDLKGLRLPVGATINTLSGMNEILLANDLPKIVTCDEGYYPGPIQSGTPSNFTRFVTNGKVVLIGAREDGEPIGEYNLCRAIQNDGGKPGEWYTFEDNSKKTDLWNMVMAMGHNGGPVPYYPEALAVINAAPSNSSEFS